MLNPARPRVQRNEEFFRYYNHNRRRVLRSRQAIATALGLVGVSAGQVNDIFISAASIWTRNSGTASNFVPRSAATMWRFEGSVAELRSAHPEVFQMACWGQEETAFVHHAAADAIIWIINEGNRRRRPRRSREAQEQRESGDEGGSPDQDPAEMDDDDAMGVDGREHEHEHEPATSSSSPRVKAKGASSTTRTNATPPPISIGVWSTREGRPLFTCPLEDVLATQPDAVAGAGTATGGAPTHIYMPSFRTLEDRARRTIPPGTPTPDINGHLQFVYVAPDGTNSSFISQEVLKLEWDDWRRVVGIPRAGTATATGTRMFCLWVRDCVTEAAHPRSLVPNKYGAWGWEYDALLNGPRFVKLPLPL
ncbi:hypothetical protein PV04_01997 [Phialophora macrospora]|uniref:Uncharacterized protein n=1 Tax=Phialophora macrospora TaxID=1851006 RepID=A0A0D2FZH7_9EURO|nr:hypothetical protein PV04_01997 [Phialophora macrospora]